MPENIDKTGVSRRPFKDQINDLIEAIDQISYKVMQKHETGDIQDTLDLNPLFFKSNVNYDTFMKNNGYQHLTQYNGIKKIPNKKKIKLNPRKYLKNRKLGQSNQYYIKELYE